MTHDTAHACGRVAAAMPLAQNFARRDGGRGTARAGVADRVAHRDCAP